MIQDIKTSTTADSPNPKLRVNLWVVLLGENIYSVVRVDELTSELLFVRKVSPTFKIYLKVWFEVRRPAKFDGRT